MTTYQRCFWMFLSFISAISFSFQHCSSFPTLMAVFIGSASLFLSVSAVKLDGFCIIPQTN